MPADAWLAATAAPLEGRLVRLLPLAREHEQALWAAADDPETWRWIEGPAPARATFAGWVEESLAERAAGREIPYATFSRPLGRLVGMTRYVALRPEHRGLEVASWLHPAAWRTGVNLEAKLLLLEQAFDRLGCLRVEFRADARNARSRAALEALGARFEGVLRRHMVMPLGVRDTACYSVVDDDWPAVRDALRERLERRLAAAGARA